MLVHIMYHPSTLSLVTNALSYIGVDFNLPTKDSSTVDAESLEIASLATIMVEPSFLYWVF